MFIYVNSQKPVLYGADQNCTATVQKIITEKIKTKVLTNDEKQVSDYFDINWMFIHLV